MRSLPAAPAAVGEQQAGDDFLELAGGVRLQELPRRFGAAAPEPAQRLADSRMHSRGDRTCRDRAHRLQHDDALDVGIRLGHAALGRRGPDAGRDRACLRRRGGGARCAGKIRRNAILDVERRIVRRVVILRLGIVRRIFRQRGIVAPRQRGFHAIPAANGTRAALGARIAERFAYPAANAAFLHPVVDDDADDERNAGGDETELQRGHAISKRRRRSGSSRRKALA